MIVLITAALTAPAPVAAEEKLVYSTQELEAERASLPSDLNASEVPIPFELDDEIRSHVDELTEGIFSPREKARRILLDLFEESELNIQYDGFATKTAREVYRVRHANCLGYTNLYVGMTRYAGLEAYYVEVKDLDDVKLLAAGRAVLVRSHICAGVELFERLELYDFASDVPKKYQQWRRISDKEAMAALPQQPRRRAALRGRPRPGGRSRTRGPGLPRRPPLLPRLHLGALNNLASVYMIDNKFEEARDIFRGIQAKGRSRATVLSNIGTTFLLESNPEEALKYYRRALKYSPKDPFILEKVGVAEESLGRLAEAVDAFQRAAAYHGRFVRPHLALGRLLPEPRRDPEGGAGVSARPRDRRRERRGPQGTRGARRPNRRGRLTLRFPARDPMGRLGEAPV